MDTLSGKESKAVTRQEYLENPGTEYAITPSKGPLTRSEIKTLALRMAGISPEELGQTIIEKLIELLAATKRVNYSYKGRIGDTDVQDDHQAQLTAARMY